ncbi:MAG: hypothetical protein IT449_15125 [Phycisphaerales bacterium]|nr:hypothetical protein [Phycisphaerales bacterium]
MSALGPIAQTARVLFRDGWRSPKVWVPAVVLIAAGGAGVWALSGQGEKQGVALPPELSAENLKKDGLPDPEKIRAAMDRKDLTDDQRRQIGQNMRESMMAVMEEHVSEYYAAATDPEREAVLDKHIDELQERMKGWEQRREEMRKEWEKRQAEQAEKTKEGEKKEGEGEQRQDPRERFGSRSTEERKTESENRSPDQMARRMAYFGAIRARMEQRGIQMPFGGMGGPGGPGGFGGPGGPGGFGGGPPGGRGSGGEGGRPSGGEGGRPSGGEGGRGPESPRP